MKTNENQLEAGANLSICQSCGMPMETDELYGTNADNTRNGDYCIYCYKGGKFVQECTMDEMIEHCVGMIDEINKTLDQKITKEDYARYLQQLYPTLKRWKE